MANSVSPFVGTDNSNFTRQFNIETVGGDQRQRLAEMLRSNALNMPQGQMVSGWYVPPSWSQNLAQLANTAVGVLGGAALDRERAQKTAEALKRFEGVEEQVPFENLPGVTTQDALMAEGQSRPEGAPMQSMANPQMMQRQTRMRPLTQDEQDMALLNLAQINPQAGQIYGTLLGTRATRAERAAEKAEQRQFTAEQNMLNRQSREDMLRLQAGLAAANRPERMITVMDETGSPFTIPQNQMQPGMTIYNPQTAKAFKERQSLNEGKQLASDQIQGLRNEYNILNKNMAITSEQNRLGSNVGAWASGTAPGQFVGKLFGTESSTARDVIRMSRPALMQTLVKASGMSAKQIDSNAEMKLMLDQATDPSAGYEANMKALDNLEKRFIGGSQQPAGLPDQSAIDAEIARRKGR